MVAEPLEASVGDQVIMLNPQAADAWDIEARFERDNIGGEGVSADLLLGSCRLTANDERVREVAAVAEKDDGVIENEHIAGLKDAVGGWAATTFRSRGHGKITVDDDRPASGFHAGGGDA